MVAGATAPTSKTSRTSSSTAEAVGFVNDIGGKNTEVVPFAYARVLANLL